MSNLDEQLDDILEFLEQSQRIVVLTGAGISTESGIPDFRSPGSYWKEHPPVTYHAFLRSAEARTRYWETRRALYPMVKTARPNAAHYALAEMDLRGQLLAVITQNFDGLHQDAGLPNEKVVELHGTSRQAACTQCGTRSSIERVQERVDQGDPDPRCPLCNGYMKAATILFGQRLSDETLQQAKVYTDQADLFLVIGSSLKVIPASHLPRRALRNNTPLIIINLQPTALDTQADVVVHEKAGVVLPRLLR